MALIPLRTLLDHAAANNYGVAAFNVNDMEQIQAIMEAGGLNEYGSFKNVHVIRIVGGRQHTQILDLRSTLRGEATQPFYVKDGDVIYVPQNPF